MKSRQYRLLGCVAVLLAVMVFAGAGAADTVGNLTVTPNATLANSGIEWVTLVTDGYTPLAYLQGTGTQYIDTGLVSGTDYVSYDIEFAPNSLEDAHIFGLYANGGGSGIGNRYFVSVWDTNGKVNLGYKSTPTAISPSYTLNTYYRFSGVLKPGTQTLNIDGVNQISKSDSSGISINKPLLLFASYNGDTGTYPPYKIAHIQIKSAKFYDAYSNELVRDFIPVKRNSDGVAGMYDTVTKQFYTNLGSGEFIKGPEISISSWSWYARNQSTGNTWTFLETTTTNSVTVPVSTLENTEFYVNATNMTIGWYFNTSAHPEQFSVYTTITLDPNGGVLSGPYSVNISLNNNTFDKDIVAPTKTGFIFNGWDAVQTPDNITLITESGSLKRGVDGYTDSSGYWINNTASALTLYANWTLSPFSPTVENLTVMPEKAQAHSGSGIQDVSLSAEMGGYTQLEFLQGTGTQYIDTGLVSGTNYVRYDIEFAPNTAENAHIFGLYSNGADPNRYFVSTWSTGGTIYLGYKAAPTEINPSYTLNTYYRFSGVLKPGTQTLNIDGVNQISKSDSSEISIHYPLLLFASYDGNDGTYPPFTIAHIQIKSAKFYDAYSDELLRDFIPVKRNSDGVAGMYDTVTKQFYANLGSGDPFVAGPEIEPLEWNWYARNLSTGYAWTFLKTTAANSTAVPVSTLENTEFCVNATNTTTGWYFNTSATPARFSIYTAITLDPNGGSGSTPEVAATMGNNTLVPSAITNPQIPLGYHAFNGWYNERDGGAAVIDTSGQLATGVSGYTDDDRRWINASSSVTLYANYTANVTTVDFYNLSVKQDRKSYTFGGLVTTPAAPARLGYQFSQWNVSNGTLWDAFDSPQYNASGIWNYTGTAGLLNVSANWTANTYNVTFHSNNGTDVTAKQQFTYDTAQNLDANTFTCRGYAFMNWSTNVAGSGTNYTDGESVRNLTATPGGNIDLYAQWKANVTRITLTGNGGTPATATVNVTFNSSTFDSAITNPVKAGCMFNGWYTALSGGVEVIGQNGALNDNVPGYTASGNKWDNTSLEVTLFANWTANQTTVQYHNITELDTTLTYEFSQAASLPPTPSRTGYTFNGWNLSSADGYQFNGNATYFTNDNKWNYTGSESVLNVFGNWSPYTYNVTFNNNTGSGIMANQTFRYDEQKALSSNTFTNSGYTFAGWNRTGASGTAVDFTDGQSVENLTDIENGVVTLYAIWTQNPAAPSSSSRQTGQTVVLPGVSYASGEQKTADISLDYLASNVITLTAAVTESLKQQSPELAAKIEQRLSAAKVAGIRLTNNKGAEAIVVVEQDVDGIDTVTFDRVYDITPAVPGDYLTEVTVTVPKSDISASGLTCEDVTIYHSLEDYGIWVPLDILSITEDENNYYYTAATDGTSPFGVLIRKIESDTPLSTTQPTQSSPAPVFGLLAGLGAAALVYRMRK